ncbi:MAG: PilZ domain-containing protein [Oscillospiraceae bacterium]|jgi:hypothetical protein|nr:PilZ domain-containing protein [Oscillospiraceae bacterium]
MATQSLDGCKAYIYNLKDELMTETTIADSYSDAMEIEVRAHPDLINGETCKVIILTSPTPYEFMATIRARGGKFVTLALYHGKEKENRRSTRYKLDGLAVIEHIGTTRLQTPIQVHLINISAGGVRIRAPWHTMAIGSIFALRLKIGEKHTQLLAEVVNSLDTSSEFTEYGCSLVMKK